MSIIRRQIEDILSSVQRNWSNFKKARYLLVKLCQLYDYDPKYNYADEEMKFNMLTKSLEKKTIIVGLSDKEVRKVGISENSR